MPNAAITLLCDSATKKTLTGKRNEYKKLVSEIITTDPPALMPQIEVSRWLKTSMRRLVQGDFLFIDCDTIITEDLSSIESLKPEGSNAVLGVCLDKHALISSHEKRDYIIQNDKRLGYSSYLSNRHFNSGVIFCADTPETHKLLNRWHKLWLFSKSKNILRDQPSLNMAIHEYPSSVTELDGIWNCQIAYNGLPYLANSKIIHYFASDSILKTSPFLLASNDVFRKIKDTGLIPDEVLKFLENPKTAFVPESRIVAGKDMLRVVNSELFEFIFLLQKKIPRFFNFFNQQICIGKKIAKFFMKKTSKKKDGGIKFYD